MSEPTIDAADLNRHSTFEDYYEPVEQVSDSRFGDIVLLRATNRPEDIIMAKEKVSANLQDCERDVFQAKERMRLRHDFLLKMLDFSTKSFVSADGRSTEYLVCGYYEYPRHDLEAELSTRRAQSHFFSGDELLRLEESTLQVLNYLRESKMVHGDLRPKYIMFASGENETHKLMDRLGDPSAPNQVQVNNMRKKLPLYMSPALFKALSQRQTKIKHNPYKSDSFSLGLILLESGTLQSVQPIFDNASKDIDMEKLLELLEDFLNRYDAYPLLKESILWLLDIDEHERKDPRKVLKLFAEMRKEEAAQQAEGEEEAPESEQLRDDTGAAGEELREPENLQPMEVVELQLPDNEGRKVRAEFGEAGSDNEAGAGGPKSPRDYVQQVDLQADRKQSSNSGLNQNRSPTNDANRNNDNFNANNYGNGNLNSNAQLGEVVTETFTAHFPKAHQPAYIDKSKLEFDFVHPPSISGVPDNHNNPVPNQQRFTDPQQLVQSLDKKNSVGDNHASPNTLLSQVHNLASADNRNQNLNQLQNQLQNQNQNLNQVQNQQPIPQQNQQQSNQQFDQGNRINSVQNIRVGDSSISQPTGSNTVNSITSQQRIAQHYQIDITPRSKDNHNSQYQSIQAGLQQAHQISQYNSIRTINQQSNAPQSLQNVQNEQRQNIIGSKPQEKTQTEQSQNHQMLNQAADQANQRINQISQQFHPISNPNNQGGQINQAAQQLSQINQQFNQTSQSINQNILADQKPGQNQTIPHDIRPTSQQQNVQQQERKSPENTGLEQLNSMKDVIEKRTEVPAVSQQQISQSHNQVPAQAQNRFQHNPQSQLNQQLSPQISRPQVPQSEQKQISQPIQQQAQNVQSERKIVPQSNQQYQPAQPFTPRQSQQPLQHSIYPNQIGQSYQNIQLGSQRQTGLIQNAGQNNYQSVNQYSSLQQNVINPLASSRAVRLDSSRDYPRQSVNLVPDARYGHSQPPHVRGGSMRFENIDFSALSSSKYISTVGQGIRQSHVEPSSHRISSVGQQNPQHFHNEYSNEASRIHQAHSNANFSNVHINNNNVNAGLQRPSRVVDNVEFTNAPIRSSQFVNQPNFSATGPVSTAIPNMESARQIFTRLEDGRLIPVSSRNLSQQVVQQPSSMRSSNTFLDQAGNFQSEKRAQSSYHIQQNMVPEQNRASFQPQPQGVYGQQLRSSFNPGSTSIPIQHQQNANVNNFEQNRSSIQPTQHTQQVHQIQVNQNKSAIIPSTPNPQNIRGSILEDERRVASRELYVSPHNYGLIRDSAKAQRSNANISSSNAIGNPNEVATYNYEVTNNDGGSRRYVLKRENSQSVLHQPQSEQFARSPSARNFNLTSNPPHPNNINNNNSNLNNNNSTGHAGGVFGHQADSSKPLSEQMRDPRYFLGQAAESSATDHKRSEHQQEAQQGSTNININEPVTLDDAEVAQRYKKAQLREDNDQYKVYRVVGSGAKPNDASVSGGQVGQPPAPFDARR